MVKILLLEDNAVDAFIAHKVIMLSGTEVRLDVAAGANEALSLLTNQYLESRELPDVILVDQFMSGPNGLQFLDGFDSLNIPGKDKVKILMLTSSIDPHVSAEAIRRGAHGIITKPITIPVITDIISRTESTESMISKDPGKKTS